jgi:hypothetical protein
MGGGWDEGGGCGEDLTGDGDGERDGGGDGMSSDVSRKLAK